MWGAWGSWGAWGHSIPLRAAEQRHIDLVGHRLIAHIVRMNVIAAVIIG